jgi:hypothetical protein
MRASTNLEHYPRGLLLVTLGIDLRYICRGVAQCDLRRLKTEPLADFRRRRVPQLASVVTTGGRGRCPAG